jgi:hypothetical protein
MSEPQIVNTLREKRKDIEKAITAYEKQVEVLRLDLAHINATLAMFETDSVRANFRVPMSIARIFRRGEAFAMCKEADHLYEEKFPANSGCGSRLSSGFRSLSIRGKINELCRFGSLLGVGKTSGCGSGPFNFASWSRTCGLKSRLTKYDIIRSRCKAMKSRTYLSINSAMRGFRRACLYKHMFI